LLDELLVILQLDQSDAECVTAIEDWYGEKRAVLEAPVAAPAAPGFKAERTENAE